MKNTIFLIAAICLCAGVSNAQQDSTKTAALHRDSIKTESADMPVVETPQGIFQSDSIKIKTETSDMPLVVTTQGTFQSDTIKIGTMIIIKKQDGSREVRSDSGIHIIRPRKEPGRLSTSWFNVDLGFSNFTDKSDYAGAGARSYARAVRPGEAAFTASDFNLQNGKSFNVNVWIFRQCWGITKNRTFNLNYGLMVETNNYRYDNNLSYVKGNLPYVFRDSVAYKKTKLATSYVTLPLMLGYSSQPGKSKGFNIAAGISTGYLYSSRNKQKSDARGKDKIKGDFDLKTWKFQYVAEIGFGQVKLYAAMAPKTMYERGLDMRPYNFGIRLGGK